MIFPADNKHQNAYEPASPAAALAQTSSHVTNDSPALPSFEESVRHPRVVPGDPEANYGTMSHLESGYRDDEEAPPPDFSPYVPECSRNTAGVFSHDSHLNEDGEALYRFLLAEAATPPKFMLHCRGTHNETRTRTVSATDNKGNVTHRTETYLEEVTDFDFFVDATPYLVPGPPVQWSVADSEPAYRGQMVRETVGEFDNELGRVVYHRASRKTRKEFKAWKSEREAKGLPPWVRQGDELPSGMATDRMVALNSSKTVRQWADEYCNSPKYLKEFTYDKVVYGWNFDSLTAAIRSLISSTYYHGNVSVKFELTNNKVAVRSHNRLSRALSNGFIKLLAIITFVYPFIWLFRRFHSHGGGQWAVCGAAYAFKRWEPVDPQELLMEGVNGKGMSRVGSEADIRYLTGGSSSSNPRLRRTDSGVTTRLVGLREGEWLQMWEKSVKQAVLGRVQDPRPLTRMEELDGYNGTNTNDMALQALHGSWN